MPDEHVAAFPNAYITAWQMLVGKAGVDAADTVFVWAGTSGLGGAAIEIGKLSGARVITSAGTEEKREVLRDGVADEVLDHHSPDLVERVLELTAARARRSSSSTSVRRPGSGRSRWPRTEARSSAAGATSGDDARMNVTYMFVKQLRILGSRLGTMADTVDAAHHLSAGHFSPLIGAVLPLEELAGAHVLLDEGRVTGKVIVKPEV